MESIEFVFDKEKTMAFEHVSVLPNETVDGLNVKPDGVYETLRLAEADMPQEVQKACSKGEIYRNRSGCRCN